VINNPTETLSVLGCEWNEEVVCFGLAHPVLQIDYDPTVIADPAITVAPHKRP
jgi:hypothetical protein